MKNFSQDVFLPLFVLQLPQKTLARYGLGQQDWSELINVLLDIDVGDSKLTETLISLEDFCQVFRLATNLFGRERHLQAYVEDIRARHMGPVGLAMEAAPTIDDSLTLWVDNADVLAPMLSVESRANEESRIFEVRLNADLGDIADTYVELVLLLTVALIRNLSCGEVGASIRYAHAQPHPDAFYQENFGLLPLFGQRENALIFSRREIRKANDYYAPLMFQQALQGIRDLRRHIESHLKLSFRVRQLLHKQAELGFFLSVEDAAAHFHMSARTLTRHLHEEGASFRELRNDVQLTIAKLLLRNSRLPIKAIADRAGFTNISAFSRAFHVACGLTPQEFRRAVESQA